MELLPKNWIVTKLHGSWCVVNSKTRQNVCDIVFGLPNTQDAALQSGLRFAAYMETKDFSAYMERKESLIKSIRKAV